MEIKKLTPHRNAAYLKFVRSQPCPLCGRKSQAHHVRRSYWGSGMAIKPHDYVTIPLCAEHHSARVERELEVERCIIELLMRYVESLRG